MTADAVVTLSLAGLWITTSSGPSVTVTVSVALPNSLRATAVKVVSLPERGTVAVNAAPFIVAATPFTITVGSGRPPTVPETATVELDTTLPDAGLVIATAGTCPRKTATESDPS